MIGALPPPVHETLRLLESANQGVSPLHVAVLGAGVAGLAAACELERLGHRVTIFEARDRLGGRIFTRRFGNEYGEFGAFSIPASHDYTRHYVSKLGLALRPFIGAFDNQSAWLDVRGQAVRISEGRQTLRTRFPLLTAWETHYPPGKLLAAHLDSVLSEMSQSNINALFSGDDETGKVRGLDTYSLGELIRSHAGSGETAEWVLGSIGLTGLQSTALTAIMRDMLTNTWRGVEEIVGGMDQLTDGLAQGVQSPVEFSTTVVGIDARPEQPSVSVSDKAGRVRTESFDRVLCSLPFPALRGVEMLGVSFEKQKAVAVMEYAPAAVTLMSCQERFWETEDGIFGGASISDRLSRLTFYPSDRADPATAQRRAGLFGGYSLDPRSITGAQGLNHGGPGVMKASYALGQDALVQGAMDEADRVTALRSAIGRFHPRINDAELVQEVESVCWHNERFSGGAFRNPQPHELLDLDRHVSRPEGSVYFAGEHCSSYPGWIQGSLVSTLRAIHEML